VPAARRRRRFNRMNPQLMSNALEAFNVYVVHE
jgi:hypothetical protein